ncbi:hypothetical protein [Haloplanus halophilus]|nr:hypothetical protein [Haloplanus sp. GDY1]
MARRNRTDDRSNATESKFYLPAGVAPPFEASRVAAIWATLFDRRV